MNAHDLVHNDCSSSLPICFNLISNSEIQIETENHSQKLTFQEIEKSYAKYLYTKTKKNEELYKCLKKSKKFVII